MKEYEEFSQNDFWTKEIVINNFKKIKEYFNKWLSESSTPIFLFDENEIFTTGNWNGGDILRNFINDIQYKSNLDLSINIVSGIIDEETYITIPCFYEDTVYLKWYKNRGRTDSIIFNDHPITLEEYVAVLNYLEVPDKYLYE